ncbi:MAG: hypothetical protein JWM46_858 [Candidatus Kaiserbacteria bacterium]|nr:hypothetical protein [Candidatus Kaiserbacteria bacterium]
MFGSYDVSDRVIVENDSAFAFPTNIPIVSGHVLIAPKRIVEKYEDLSEAERSAIEDLRQKIKHALTTVFAAEGFNYAWNEARIGGQSVPHFHLHVVPRKEGDAGISNYEPREFLYRPGPRPESPDAELVEVANSVRAAL